MTRPPTFGNAAEKLWGSELQPCILKTVVEAIYDRRLKLAPASIKAEILGRGPIKHRIWLEGTTLGLHVGNPDEIREAEKRLQRWKNAYPNLVGSNPRISLTRSVNIPMEGAHIGVEETAVAMDGACSISLRNVVILTRLSPIPYAITFMAIVSVARVDDFSFKGPELLDDLLAKEASRARMRSK